MKRTLNIDLIKDWTKSVGGLSRATGILLQQTQWSLSKAEKVAAGRYYFLHKLEDRKLLSKITGLNFNVLFPVEPKRSKKAS